VLTLLLPLIALRMPTTLVELAIWVVVLAGVAALVFIALREFKITIPPWVVQAFWVVVVGLAIIFAIRLLASA
jgi:hypothetical protein